MPTATIGVTAYTTMLDMDMGTTPVDLQADDNGNFTASFEYAMSGDWQIRLKVLANNTLHNATIKLVVPA